MTIWTVVLLVPRVHRESRMCVTYCEGIRDPRCLFDGLFQPHLAHPCPAEGQAVCPSNLQLGFTDTPTCQLVSNGLCGTTVHGVQVRFNHTTQNGAHTDVSTLAGILANSHMITLTPLARLLTLHMIIAYNSISEPFAWRVFLNGFVPTKWTLNNTKLGHSYILPGK